MFDLLIKLCSSRSGISYHQQLKRWRDIHFRLEKQLQFIIKMTHTQQIKMYFDFAMRGSQKTIRPGSVAGPEWSLNSATSHRNTVKTDQKELL